MENLSTLNRQIGAALTGPLGGLAARWLSRPFPRREMCRVLIYYHNGPISWSQVYPYLHYADGFAKKYHAAIRFLPIERFLERRKEPAADVVLIQPWFTESPETLMQALDALANRLPGARISFLDSFAHNDLRLARTIDHEIRFYLKKSLFRDRRQYLKAFRGDTNLTEYYGERYGIDIGEPVDWQVPAATLDKLRLSPNFFTAPRFLSAFRQDMDPKQEKRTIDVQSRIALKGSPWYTAMREEAQQRIEAIEGIELSPPGKLPLKDFMAELGNSKLCFSPFGYGELCWRDIEAFQAGAVLVKPDMGHLETAPELYEPGVTYLPVRWDLADLEQTVLDALADTPRRTRIAQEAYRRVADYIHAERFVDDMNFLFEQPISQPSRA